MPGNPLGQRCSICASPFSNYINAMIAEGVGADTIQKRVPSVSLDSIKRHRENGHAERAIAALAVAVPEEHAATLGTQAAINASSLIDKSAKLMERAESFASRAEASGDLNAMAKALATCERAIRLAADLVGAFPQRGATNIDNRSITINGLAGMSKAELLAIASGNDDA